MSQFTGIEITSCPSEAALGELVEVEVRTANRSFSPYNKLETVVAVKGKKTGTITRFIDEVDIIAPGDYKFHSGTFEMFNEDVTVMATVLYWDPFYGEGAWRIDATEDKDIGVMAAPPPPPPGYWVTVAEGSSIEELQANAAGKYVGDEFRYVIETRGAPDWLLKGAAWITNHLTAPLNAIGVGLEYVGIKDGTIYIYMHGSPAVFSTTAIVVACIAAFTIVAVYCYKYMIQQKLTEEQYYKLKEAEVKADVTEAIKDLPPEVQDTILELWEAGVEPEKEEVVWLKIAKWGAIGLGVILIVPRILELIPKARRAT